MCYKCTSRKKTSGVVVGCTPAGSELQHFTELSYSCSKARISTYDRYRIEYCLAAQTVHDISSC